MENLTAAEIFEGIFGEEPQKQRGDSAWGRWDDEIDTLDGFDGSCKVTIFKDTARVAVPHVEVLFGGQNYSVPLASMPSSTEIINAARAMIKACYIRPWQRVLLSQQKQ
jgi:hypothetical protein